jgi:hypothetical protein
MVDEHIKDQQQQPTARTPPVPRRTPECVITLICQAGHLDVKAPHVDGTAVPLDETVVVPGKPLVINRT